MTARPAPRRAPAPKGRTFDHVAVRPRAGRPAQGWLRAGERVLPVALGRGGVRADKREGDGATPLGLFRFRAAFAPLAGPVRAAPLPFRTVGPRDGWCDASGNRNYNRPVRLPYAASHETLTRADRLYDRVLVVDHNRAGTGRPGLRGRGSAVFVHVAREGFAPTEGCVALAPRDMAWLWERVGPNTRLLVTR